MKIAICDDEVSFLQKLRNDLLSIQDFDNEFIIKEFSSGEELLNNYHANDFDIIFLDIEMKTLNGMDTADCIRRIDQKAVIVFLTNYEKFAVKGYEVGAFRYILKDQPVQVYKQQLVDTIKSAHCLHWDIAVTTNGEIRKISASDIVYIEVYGHTICIHMVNNDEITFSGKMKDIEMQLSGLDFVKIDRSHLINTDKIKSVSDLQIVLEGKKEPTILYASRKYIKDIKIKFMESFKRRFG